MKLNIEPYQLKIECDSLYLKVISTTTESFTIYYELIRSSDGYKAEVGNKELPIQHIGLFGETPTDIETINTLLSYWNLTASSRAD